MILDPSRDGLEVFYDNKVRSLVGTPENCINWVIKICCEPVRVWESSKELYVKSNLFDYKGKTWEQLSEIYLDVKGIGRVYMDYLDRIGIEFKRLDVKRVDL